MVAALLGLAFKNVLYKTEDVCDRLWRHRPERSAAAVGGVALGLLLLVVPQLYGVGYSVMYKAVAGSYALWFLVVLVFTKMVATSLQLTGSAVGGCVFAPSLFIGATSGMAFGEIADHLFGLGVGQPALYAVVAMGAVFHIRRPGRRSTSLASVVEMTGDYTLTLPVMLAVAIATVVSGPSATAPSTPPSCYGEVLTSTTPRRPTPSRSSPPPTPCAQSGPRSQPSPHYLARPAVRKRTERRCPGRSPTRVPHRSCSPMSPWPKPCASWSTTAAMGCR